MSYFAVLDTETSWRNEVMSIGVVIADENYNLIDKLYLVIEEEVKIGGMYENVIYLDSLDDITINTDLDNAFLIINNKLKEYNIIDIFAYNASFDKKHMRGLYKYLWYDIMKVAAYKQHNLAICHLESFKSGRLIRGYGVENMYKILACDDCFKETHNALYDAIDELAIMRFLAKPLSYYSVAKI